MDNCFLKRRTDNEYLPSWGVRIRIFLFALIQNGLVGGIIFGWASIDQSILTVRRENGGAGLTHHETALIFSWASSVAMISSLILGFVLDRYGPRFCSIFSSMIIAIGCQLFGTLTNFTGLAVGACLISFGGPGINASIIHIANLFPGNENLAMASLAGSIALSFSMFAVFDTIWETYDLSSYGILFQYFGILTIVLAFGALINYPDEPYEQFNDDKYDELLLSSHETNESMTTTAAAKTIPYEQPSSQEVTALLEKSTESNKHHHDDHHIQSVSRVSLKLSQPLDSYLRDEVLMVDRTDSFFAAKKALKDGNGNGDDATSARISLKDQPFWNQLFSGTYLRAFLVFLATSFATNFYVVSLSTELGDSNDFNLMIQHQLARTFTLVMSMGFFASIFVGWLIDRIGLEICTALTLILGQVQALIIVLFGGNYTMMVTSFWVYAVFRQFLYPVYIASLTSRLGFKYFGVLLGIGFALGGIAQLYLAPLLEFVQGDCHNSSIMVVDEAESSSQSHQVTCNEGRWMFIHWFQFVCLGLLLLVPLADYRDRMNRQMVINKVLHGEETTTKAAASNNYGSAV